MVFMFDEYVAEFPNRALQALNKFADSPKNLHEMSADEISEVFTKSGAMSEKTAMNQRSDIRLYLNWLQSKGVKCNPDVVNKVEHMTDTKQFRIFNTDDLDREFKKLYAYLDKVAEEKKSSYSRVPFLMNQVADILAFYGLTVEQIIALRLTDVTIDGVAGYDLPLTKYDKSLLMSYRNTRKSGNKMLLGDTYIRTTSPMPVQPRLISNPLSNIKYDDEHEYLKSLLRVSNVYDLGVLNRIYEREQTESEKILAKRSAMPQWAVEIAKLSDNTTTRAAFKHNYIDYRDEREKSKKLEFKIDFGNANIMLSHEYKREDGLITGISEKPIRELAVGSYHGGTNKVAFTPNPVAAIKQEIKTLASEMQSMVARLDKLSAELDTMESVYAMSEELIKK